MQPIYEHNLTLAGVRTRAVELDGEGPKLILIHGYADSADTWRLLLDRLRKRGRGAVALDMPGLRVRGRGSTARGRSCPSSTPSWTPRSPSGGARAARRW